MDVKDKLVEVIDKARLLERETLGSMNRGLVDWYADYLIAHGVTVQEWISVEEMMPEQDGKYIVYTRTGFTGMSYYYAIEGAFGFDRWDVTHWMPLPEPPKGGE
jgi:hypothetical protein